MILRRILKVLLKVVGCLTLVLIFNEFIIYYTTLVQVKINFVNLLLSIHYSSVFNQNLYSAIGRKPFDQIM